MINVIIGLLDKPNIALYKILNYVTITILFI